MTGDIIKSFLVGLGFGVDDASLAKFNKAILSATARVGVLYSSIKVASAGIYYAIGKISEGFEQMGYEYRIIAPAINKTLMLRRELLRAYSAAGVNITKVIQQSVRLNFSLAKTKFAFEAIYKSVASRFFPLITKQSDTLRKKIFANMPAIQGALEKFVKFVFKALDASLALGSRMWSILSRIYDFFYKLHRQTEGWSTIILGIAAAWKILNLAFLSTPLGQILAGFLAILALYDDFQTFVEDGQSLIDWGDDFTKTLVGLGAAVAAVAAAFAAWQIISKVIGLIKLFNAGLAITDILLIIAEAPFYAIAAAIGLIVAGLTLADSKFKIFGGNLSGFFSGIGGKILGFLGGEGYNAAANLQNNPVSGSTPQVPLGAASAANHAQTNQHVDQQTSIIVQGSANADATGKSVAAEQSKVNFDMVRNLRGATR